MSRKERIMKPDRRIFEINGKKYKAFYVDEPAYKGPDRFDVFEIDADGESGEYICEVIETMTEEEILYAIKSSLATL